MLALDLITDFEFPDGARLRRALARRRDSILRLLSRARRAAVPVIYVNDNLGEWRSDAGALLARCEGERRLGAALVRALRPGPRDLIVLKPRHSAFFGTPLMALLDDSKIDTLILIGVSAESCVWMTACDAHTRGFRLVVPIDTMAGASPRAVRATMTGLADVLGARTPARAASLRLARGAVR